jgi:hypothetical protein
VLCRSGVTHTNGPPTNPGHFRLCPSPCVRHASADWRNSSHLLRRISVDALRVAGIRRAARSSLMARRNPIRSLPPDVQGRSFRRDDWRQARCSETRCIVAIVDAVYASPGDREAIAHVAAAAHRSASIAGRGQPAEARAPSSMGDSPQPSEILRTPLANCERNMRESRAGAGHDACLAST